MNPVLQRSHGLWIGWAGSSSEDDDPKRREALRRWAENERYITVDLPAQVAERYYEGYSNQTLWPLFHQFPSRIAFDSAGWDAYLEANRRFCEVVAAHYRDGDLIWVHDYHLMLLPQLLREALPEARIGFFLHIPFPSSEVFRILPRREELLTGLLGADLLAFQTHSHVHHFRNSLLRILGVESGMDQVESAGRAIRLEALPIGIAPDDFSGLLSHKETVAHLEELQTRFKDRRILLAVDRIDYTKGIPERLRAFRRLLESAPELRGVVVLLQLAVPSRERIGSYERLQREVNELVGEINGQFATPGWTPVVYIRRGVARAQLVALYAAAEVGWVAPLRDGMNLVAKEFVACQRDDRGVLVLSEFAGAAAEMGEALLLNPYDEQRAAEVLQRALALPAGERQKRMAALRKRVRRNNVFAWSDRFLSILREAGAAERTGADQAEPLRLPAVAQAYREAPARLLFLDYDGTLAPYAGLPEQAVPPPDLLTLLERLANRPGNRVTLISGRRRDDLEQWFGGIQGLWLAAEHGAIVRAACAREWETPQVGRTEDWKSRVQAVLDHYADRTPGSFVEEKQFSLVWHYRMSDPEFGEWLAHELVSLLEGMLADTDLRATRGQKTVEVKPLWANKGEFAERMLAAFPETGFELAVGDDRTDEDLFLRMPPGAWTVRVGGGPTRARFSLPDPRSVRQMLAHLAALDTVAAG